MLENWISPLDKSTFSSIQNKSEIIFNNVIFFESKMEISTIFKLAIVGFDKTHAIQIRQYLYGLYSEIKLEILDLGTLKENKLASYKEVFDFLNKKNIPLISINAANSDLFGFFNKHESIPNISLAYLGQDLDAKHKNKYSFPLILKNKNLLNFYAIGIQKSLLKPSFSRQLNENSYNLFRLGQTRPSVDFLEPYLRDTDLLILDGNALRYHDLPSQDRPSLSGFNIEELCKLSYYTGFSRSIKSFGLFGFKTNKKKLDLSVQAVSQIIWYFITGIHSKQSEFPIRVSNLTKYVVTIDEFEKPLVFWKSKKTNRWWFQFPYKSKILKDKLNLIACSYEDYVEACQNQIPEKIISSIRKYC